MGRRLALHDLLLTFCDNVYFQAPENVIMQYPAILYEPADEIREHANNNIYGLTESWELTIIDYDPDSPIRENVRMLPMCSFDRFFRTQGLNHFVYTLNY